MTILVHLVLVSLLCPDLLTEVLYTVTGACRHLAIIDETNAARQNCHVVFYNKFYQFRKKRIASDLVRCVVVVVCSQAVYKFTQIYRLSSE